MGGLHRQYQNAPIIIKEAVLNTHRHHGVTGWRAIAHFSRQWQPCRLHFLTMVSAIHAFYLQFKWMIFICLWFVYFLTWHTDLKVPVSTASNRLGTVFGHTNAVGTLTCLFSLLFPCPRDKPVSFLSFWWVADCTIVVPTCHGCPAQTLCCKCICSLALGRNR